MGNDEYIDKLEEIILEEGKKSHPKTILLCPVCNSRRANWLHVPI